MSSVLSTLSFRKRELKEDMADRHSGILDSREVANSSEEMRGVGGGSGGRRRELNVLNSCFGLYDNEDTRPLLMHPMILFALAAAAWHWLLQSVFQFYDPDERGLISREDFEKVISSFPFSCQILEKDREGPVAREEMTAYFMKASQVCSRLGLPFLQSLVEIRLKETPLCANCIWSVAKQGYVTAGLRKDVMENWPTSQGSVERKSEKHGPHVSGAADPSRMIAHCVGGCKKSETLLKKLKETEEERNRLLLENTGLHCTNSQLAAENANLHSQLCALQDKVQALSKDSKMKPAALTQILETLKALKIQSDTTP
ncbi:unnamed protein product [Ranitomeya imitator]|uniref:EF-hand domain-containing protein n=1 Tax=Ranitomeya imitator TaxID=111125 RepID=A0ABN9M358_9NEOB|nr:unnamed protein product [Ranitomeya imitator]